MFWESAIKMSSLSKNLIAFEGSRLLKKQINTQKLGKKQQQAGIQSMPLQQKQHSTI